MEQPTTAAPTVSLVKDTFAQWAAHGQALLRQDAREAALLAQHPLELGGYIFGSHFRALMRA